MDTMLENMNSVSLVEKIGVLSACLGLSYAVVRHIWSFLKIEKEPIDVLVTGAAGDVSYAVVPMIARGVMFGPDQPLILHLLDDDEPESVALMKALETELMDSAFPLLKGVISTTNLSEAYKDVDVAILVRGYPINSVDDQKMKREDVIAKNVAMFKAHALALNKHAADDCKVLVVANPSNTNALILKELSSLPAKNITCLTRHYHNRTISHISKRLDVSTSDVNNVVVWGNHSSTLFPDINHAVVATTNKRVRQLITPDDSNRLSSEIQECGVSSISSAISVASAICDHIHDWLVGTPKGKWVSMGVCSDPDGFYGIQSGLIFSVPVTCKNRDWYIAEGLEIDEFNRKKMDIAMRELVEEKEIAYSCLGDRI